MKRSAIFVGSALMIAALAAPALGQHAHGAGHGAHALAAGPAAPEPLADLEGKIDLAPLRTVAVQDGGRRKPFDTFAREKVKLIFGTSRYQRQDPLYTVLSLMFEADRWASVEAIKIYSLELMDLLGRPRKSSVKICMREVDRSKKFDEALEAVSPDPKKRGPFENALLELQHRRVAFYNLRQAMRFVPIPGAPSEAPWSSIADLEGQPEIVRAELLERLRRLESSFRKGDAPAVGGEIAALSSRLRELQAAAAPPGWHLELEAALNRSQPFTLSWVIFVISALMLGIASRTGGRISYWIGVAALLAGLLVATAGLTARTIITGRAPVGNLYEMIIFSAFAAVLAGALFEARYRTAIFGTAAAASGFLAFLLADAVPTMDTSITPLVPVLRSYWLNIHVTAMGLSYGIFMVAFVLSLAYFYFWLPSRGLPRWAIAVPIALCVAGAFLPFRRVLANEMPRIFDFLAALVLCPALGIGLTWLWVLAKSGSASASSHDDSWQETIERFMTRLVQVGFVFSTAGIVLGAVWANESWGRYWGWDPKETWAFITWAIYGVYLHGRIQGWFRGATAAIWPIVGFAAVLFTLFGVSYVLPGLHSYLQG